MTIGCRLIGKTQKKTRDSGEKGVHQSLNACTNVDHIEEVS